MSPVAAKIEEIVLAWIIELLGLPQSCGAGFVTGTTMANFSALAAARTALLQRAGWDVEDSGLFGAPPLRVLVGEKVHVSLLKALALLGLGRSRVISVPADGQGRMKAGALPELDERTLICIQAGNVNTGAFDPAEEICSRAREAGTWVHVDGAFGLWAAASPHYAPLLQGVSHADSWAIDCHKWLNVPYDSGIELVRAPEHLQKALALTAAYLQTGEVRGFGNAEETRRVIAGVQDEGTCWCGGTRWHGRTAMRISVSSWATTEEDVERSLAAILRIATGRKS
jgi:glutamate/tyrosine decarboxylase-like PLP-dependent enzyme